MEAKAPAPPVKKCMKSGPYATTQQHMQGVATTKGKGCNYAEGDGPTGSYTGKNRKMFQNSIAKFQVTVLSAISGVELYCWTPLYTELQMSSR